MDNCWGDRAKLATRSPHQESKPVEFRGAMQAFDDFRIVWGRLSSILCPLSLQGI